MVHQPVIPNTVIANWSQFKTHGIKKVYAVVKDAKKNAPAFVQGANSANAALAWADMKVLFIKFDKDLSGAMKKANAAGDDTAAVHALREVVKICKAYEPMITKYGAKGPSHNLVSFAVLDALRLGPLKAANEALSKLPTGKSVT